MKKQFTKFNKPITATAEKISLIKNTIGNYLELLDWQLAYAKHKNEEYEWLWFKDISDKNYSIPHRQFLELKLYSDNGDLFCTQGLQHAALLELQELSVQNLPIYWHFYQDILANFSDEWLMNNINIDDITWTYNLKSSEKTLKARLANLTKAIESGENNYYNYLINQFPKKFCKRAPQKYIKAYEKGTFLPKHFIFNCLKTSLLAFVYFGNPKQKQAYINLLKDNIEDAMKERSVWYKEELKPVIESLDKGKTPKFPLVRHGRYAFSNT